MQRPSHGAPNASREASQPGAQSLGSQLSAVIGIPYKFVQVLSFSTKVEFLYRLGGWSRVKEE